MANRPKTKMIFPRGARRQSMLQVGMETPAGTIIAVRKQTKKYSKHYLIHGFHLVDGDIWMRRDELGI